MSSSPKHPLGGGASIFSGYHPIEVTHEDFRRSVTNTKSEDEDEIESNKGGKKSCIPHRSMTRRIGNILLAPRKKKTVSSNEPLHYEGDVQNLQEQHHYLQHCSDGSSTSGVSNQGQQSVANKTVDSQTTIKMSNKQDVGGQALTSSSPRSTIRKQSKPWKTLKRLVKGASSSRAHGTTVDRQQRANSAHGSNRKHAKSYDGITATDSTGLAAFRAFSSSSLLNTAYPIRKRIQSEDPTTSSGNKQEHSPGTKQGSVSFSGVVSTFSALSNLEPQLTIDRAIRGRLDGIDVLSLGPASRSSLPEPKSSDKVSSFLKHISDHSNTNSNTNHLTPLEEPLRVIFTDLPSIISTADLVSEMIAMSGGKEQTELIFEGFVPGGGDRWSVKISPEEHLSCSTNDSNSYYSSHCPPTLQSTTDDDESSTAISSHDDGSTNLPTNRLWHNLWGNAATPPPIPSHMQTTTHTTTKHARKLGDTSGARQQSHFGVIHPDDEDSDEDPLHGSASEEHIQQFAATCNVPIDLDDDAFIIDSPDHLRSVHELVMVPLQTRRFDMVISIFQKLLRGLEGQQKFQHLVGATHHNMGIVHLCQGHYGDALHSFQKAVHVRNECLPSHHPDIAVSLMQQGMASFALQSIDDALMCFEKALAGCEAEDATRGKVLNNIGVAQYQTEDYSKALKSFTKALEIQRQWLDGPVRREAIVYDASITLANMGKVYLRKGDYDLAYFVFEEAWLIQTSSFRKDHDIGLTSLDIMARVHAKNGNQAEALRIFTSLLRSQEARFGGESEICIETIGMKGLTHFKLLEFEESLDCMNRVFAWQLKHMARSHPSIQATKQKIKQIQRCLHGEEPMWV